MTNDEYRQLIVRFGQVEGGLSQVRLELHEFRVDVDARFRQVHTRFDGVEGLIRLEEE